MTDGMRRKVQEHSDVRWSLHGELGQAVVSILTVICKSNHNRVQVAEGTPGENTLIEVHMAGSSLLKVHHSFEEAVDRVGCILLEDSWEKDETYLVDLGCILLEDKWVKDETYSEDLDFVLL